MQFRLKVDSKGRIYLPREVREEIGDFVILEKSEEGFILKPGEVTNFLEEFKRSITSEPPRTGKPENWPPSKMKAIWRPPS
ncbi:MAG: AbrB/MazE/SpoVT family DNA-binding domain-containing protein [archaeon GB-1845-036]|nr:AbrB/MazE/SpoVT family DNA-binding domain-containing protein [Candidatus Culexmicrobium thermophilum]RLE53609.1 MAG: hypothetical protein DRJ30_06675 [Candidatus Verstraetearchaeota archaeon]HDO21216.1 AbrB/MazE/SpoVT family DNA-binding domain-containing protein [Candidatus Bathyarchaeota archaeon]